MIIHILADTPSTSPANVTYEYALLLLAGIAIFLMLGILVIWQVGKIWHTQDIKAKKDHKPPLSKQQAPGGYDQSAQRVQVTEDDQPSNPEDWLFEKDNRDE